MTPERDPRRDPKVGDLLRPQYDSIVDYRVTGRVGDMVQYERVPRIAITYGTCTLERWGQWSKEQNAEVIHRAD